MSSAQSLRDLAATISAHADALSTYHEQNNLPIPNINDYSSHISVPKLPKEMRDIRRNLADVARKLYMTVLGPGEVMNLHIFSSQDAATLGAISKFRIAQNVPLNGSISFKELAKKVPICEDKLSRILRFAFSNYIFREYPPGHVSHTAQSALIVHKPNTSALIEMVTVDTFPAPSALTQMLLQWPYSEVPIHSARNIGYRTDETYFDWLRKDDGRSKRFDLAMVALAEVGNRYSIDDVNAYPWGTLGKGAKVVDIAGGNGHISCAIAAAYPDLKFIVQDQAQIVPDSMAWLANQHPELEGRVSYMEHDFWKVQPFKEADVYFLRFIIHDWPKAECVKILQNVIPAMKPGARIMISEYVMPELGSLTMIEEKLVRQCDITMMAQFNAKERYSEEIQELFALASPDLVYNAEYKANDNTPSRIFEAIYKPSSAASVVG